MLFTETCGQASLLRMPSPKSVLRLVGACLALASALGFAAALVAPTFPSTPPLWAVLSGLITSVLVGVLAGYWPARRAASLDPVEALRYE